MYSKFALGRPQTLLFNGFQLCIKNAGKWVFKDNKRNRKRNMYFSFCECECESISHVFLFAQKFWILGMI